MTLQAKHKQAAAAEGWEETPEQSQSKPRRTAASRCIVMLGPDPGAQGGMASVIRTYRDNGLFAAWNVVLLPTMVEGPLAAKVGVLLRTVYELITMLIAGRVGVVHIHVAQNRSFLRKALLFLLCHIAARPIVFHIHGAEFDVYYKRSSGPLRWLIRSVLDRSSCIVVLSESWRRWIMGVTSNPKVVSLPNPVAIPLSAPVRASSAEDQTLLFLGRLGKRKGIYDLLAVVERLKVRHRRLELLCAGDGELDRVQAQAVALGIEAQVHLLGWISGAEKERLFAQSCVCVLPSYHEGLPIAVLEAMAAGMPIVASDVGGIPEAVTDGQEGFLIQPGDIDALEQALDTLLSDRQLREAMGNAARRKAVRTYSTEVSFRELGRIYEALGYTPVIDLAGDVA